jgi:hypothetical protein
MQTDKNSGESLHLKRPVNYVHVYNVKLVCLFVQLYVIAFKSLNA